MSSSIAASSTDSFRPRATPSHSRSAMSSGTGAEAPMFPTTPIYAQTRRSAGFAGVSPAVLLAGGVAVIALVGVAFALGGPREPAPAAIAATPMIETAAPSAAPIPDPATAPSQALAPADPPMAEPAAAAPEPRRETRVARVRPASTPPAAAQSAEEASATLPSGPTPYAALDGVAASSPAPAPAEPATVPQMSPETTDALPPAVETPTTP